MVTGRLGKRIIILSICYVRRRQGRCSGGRTRLPGMRLRQRQTWLGAVGSTQERHSRLDTVKDMNIHIEIVSLTFINYIHSLVYFSIQRIYTFSYLGTYDHICIHSYIAFIGQMWVQRPHDPSGMCNVYR